MAEELKGTGKSQLVILHRDDETFELILDGLSIGTANHDDDGWSGMEKIKRLMYVMGDRLDFEIVERHAIDEDEEVG